MKFTLLTMALSIGPVAIDACVTAHVYQRDCAFGGDTLSAQVFDNDVEVCNGSHSTNLSGGGTVYCIDGCRPGYSFCVTGNGKTATYKNGNVYSKTMTAAKYQSSPFDCGSIQGSEYESCFSDFYWNCAQHRPCDLCDYRAHC